MRWHICRNARKCVSFWGESWWHHVGLGEKRIVYGDSGKTSVDLGSNISRPASFAGHTQKRCKNLWTHLSIGLELAWFWYRLQAISLAVLTRTQAPLIWGWSATPRVWLDIRKYDNRYFPYGSIPRSIFCRLGSWRHITLSMCTRLSECFGGTIPSSSSDKETAGGDSSGKHNGIGTHLRWDSRGSNDHSPGRKRGSVSFALVSPLQGSRCYSWWSYSRASRDTWRCSRDSTAATSSGDHRALQLSPHIYMLPWQLIYICFLYECQPMEISLHVF